MTKIPLRLLLATATVATVALVGATGALACGNNGGYSYAGIGGPGAADGVSALISPLDAFNVVNGHVAGWVGVGGVGLGPGGSSEWIQVGLSAFPDSGSSIYYEVRQPDWAAKYVLVKANVAPGERHRVAVLEVHGRPGVWRVWMDGRAVSPPYYLPGSHAGWEPQATGESWNDGAGVCNNYEYSFAGISLSARPGGTWRSLSSRGFEFEDAGYSMTRRSPTSFIAASRGLLRRPNAPK
ncbi:MAG: hypothetical protein ACXVRK_01970 [Gaiellaceae bacterium]